MKLILACLELGKKLQAFFFQYSVHPALVKNFEFLIPRFFFAALSADKNLGCGVSIYGVVLQTNHLSFLNFPANRNVNKRGHVITMDGKGVDLTSR